MNDKNNNKNQRNKFQLTQKRDYNQQKQSGIYLRDDHCDWGSSGMNEYTNEYPLHIISDDK
jgi:hypothetical protein